MAKKSIGGCEAENVGGFTKEQLLTCDTKS